MINRLAITVVAAVALATSTTAQADDFAPPDFRGGPLSVMAEWEFGVPFTSVDIPADTVTSVGRGDHQLFSGFQTKAELDSASNWLWTMGDGDGGITPSGPNGANVAFKVQNWIDFEIEKQIRIQVTYQGSGQPIIAGMTGFGLIPGGSSDGFFQGGMIVNPNQFYEDWTIRPNPWWELIEVAVPFGTTLDQVVIDTISLPAPGAAALVAVGALLFTRRRR